MFLKNKLKKESSLENEIFNDDYEEIKFTPKWKELMLCEYKNHNFVLDFPMGIPTLYLPISEQWNLIAPDWAKKIYSQLEIEAIKYCKNNKISFMQEKSHYFFFDGIEYKFLPQDGKGIIIGSESYIIKTSDGKHTIFLKQEIVSPSLEERNQKIIIDENKIDVVFSDYLLMNDPTCENIFFSCIDKSDNKKIAIYNLIEHKLSYLPDFINNFYIENEYIKGFDDSKKSVEYKYKDFI